MAETGIMAGYVHPHPHPHTQLKKSGIPHTNIHTQSMRGFVVKTGTRFSHAISNYMRKKQGEREKEKNK